MAKNSLQCLHESSAQHFEACKQQKGEKSKIGEKDPLTVVFMTKILQKLDWTLLSLLMGTLIRDFAQDQQKAQTVLLGKFLSIGKQKDACI